MEGRQVKLAVADPKLTFELEPFIQVVIVSCWYMPFIYLCFGHKGLFFSRLRAFGAYVVVGTTGLYGIPEAKP